MANNFIIRKGLIVSGSDLQPLNIQGTTGQLFNVASSSKGNTFSVNNKSGIPLLKVSGSELTLGLKNYSGSIAVSFYEIPQEIVIGGSNIKVNIIGSALLESAKVSNILQIGQYSFYAQQEALTQGDQYFLSTGYHSHTEGTTTSATGNSSHAEGGPYVVATGNNSHAEGAYSVAVKNYSHAEGIRTDTYGIGSHTQGYWTKTSASFQSAQGQYNATSSQQSALIIGNGLANNITRNLIYAYGTGSDGVVEISGSLRVTGEILGSYNTQVSQQTISTYTLTNLDLGQEFLFKNNCDITLPSGLVPGFSITATTLDTLVYFLTGSGVTLINNKGTTLPMKASVTIINTGTIDEYLILGDL